MNWNVVAAALLCVAAADAMTAPDRKLRVLPGGTAAMRDAAIGAVAATATAGPVGDYETGEVLVAQPSLDAAVRIDARVRALGGQLLRRREFARLNFVLSTYRMPAATPLPAKLQQLVDATPDLLADLNHRYRLAGDARDPKSQTFSAQIIGWPASDRCAEGVRVGLIDSAVDTTRPALRRAHIRQASFLPGGVDAAATDHGTAIAGLLVGDHANARFGGLIPRAELHVAQVFRREDDGESSTAEWVVAGLDWLAQQQVRVINVSFGGPSNRVLLSALERLQGLDIKIVAAAGNGGPDAEPEFPAAWDPAIAVTAVDADRAIYADANRGDYVDFAAPGVDVWTIGGDDGRFVSGTSFAAPFVTAAIAAGMSEDALAQDAIDLGTPGPDRVFGRGLVQLRRMTCAP